MCVPASSLISCWSAPRAFIHSPCPSVPGTPAVQFVCVNCPFEMSIVYAMPNPEPGPSDPDSPKMQKVFCPAGWMKQQPLRCHGYVPPGTCVQLLGYELPARVQLHGLRVFTTLVTEGTGQAAACSAGAAAPVAPAGAKEVDQRPNTHDPFWDGQNDILKTFSFNYDALTEYKQKMHRSEMCGLVFFPPALICAILTYP